MYKTLFIPFFTVISFLCARSQDSLSKEPVSAKKVWLVAGGHAAVWTGSFIALNKAWYAGYPRSSFHTFNDNNEWNYIDKAGHVWTTYHLSRVSGELWKWTGIPSKKSILLGGISGIAYQSIIEIQDGFSSEWGFSWGDMAANIGGAAAYVTQELGWKEQRVQIKMSYWPYDYPNDLIARRNQLFGKSIQERMLKDYNSQTYWISVNIKSFLPQTNLPAWLNISAGYKSDGMLGGIENKWTDAMGHVHERYDIPRVRRFFIAPDVDLTKIKTRSRIIRNIFFALNAVKFPAPALELSARGRLKVHAVYF